jgi:phosphohistidine phosphatase
MEPCDLYIVRHAIAAERGEEWPDDSKRPLTEAGVNRFREVVEGLAWLGIDIDEIFTSPLVRAKQTATLLAHGLGNTVSVKTLDALAPGHSPRQVINDLSRAAKNHRIALVGHEPGLGELAAHLIGAARQLPFKKGGVCYITIQGLTSRRPGELVWFIPPKVLRRLHQ